MIKIPYPSILQHITKTDHGSNLMGGIIKELSEKMGIWQDTSSAYHAAGNKLAENAVGRIKKAIGGISIAEEKADIVDLNHVQPYNNKTLTPFEAMYGLVSPVKGIPMTDQKETELVSREWTTEKKNKDS